MTDNVKITSEQAEKIIADLTTLVNASSNTIKKLEKEKDIFKSWIECELDNAEAFLPFHDDIEQHNVISFICRAKQVLGLPFDINKDYAEYWDKTKENKQQHSKEFMEMFEALEKELKNNKNADISK